MAPATTDTLYGAVVITTTWDFVDLEREFDFQIFGAEPLSAVCILRPKMATGGAGLAWHDVANQDRSCGNRCLQAGGGLYDHHMMTERTAFQSKNGPGHSPHATTILSSSPGNIRLSSTRIMSPPLLRVDLGQGNRVYRVY